MREKSEPKKFPIGRTWLEKAYHDCLPYVPPIRLDVSITTACNTQCSYCWQQEKSGSELTFESVAGIIDTLCWIRPPKLCLTGGEPTLWLDFEKLLAYAHDSGIKSILLCTNGLRLQDAAFLQKITQLGVTSINVSVDTLNPEKFQALRGYDFSILQKVLSNCAALRRKNKNITISLCSVISKAVTPQELFEVKQFCDDHDFGYFTQTFYPTRYSDVNRKFVLSFEEKQQYHQKLTWLKGRVSEAVKRSSNPLLTHDFVKCYKGITTVKLSSDGSIAFCWNSPSIGNILNNSFVDIWTSPKARKVRQYIRDKQCDCYFDCDVFESLELYGDV